MVKLLRTAKKEYANEQGTTDVFSIIFSPSILREIPVELDNSLGLEWLSTRRF